MLTLDKNYARLFHRLFEGFRLPSSKTTPIRYHEKNNLSPSPFFQLETIFH